MQQGGAGFGDDVGYFTRSGLALFADVWILKSDWCWRPTPSAGLASKTQIMPEDFSQRNAVDLPGAAQPTGCLATFPVTGGYQSAAEKRG
ncbi:hypothetical protein KCP70_12075 [Salmonella enterica subsp. enterica]|nr:hypothetical protein KCP70_12075 [Salmonella enterica subsp. enterica]